MTYDKFLTTLSQDLLETLDNEEYYDITIEVGSIPYVKMFRSHTVILHCRSPYLREILSNKKDNDGTLAHIKLPNILPETFQVILRYIYSGRLPLKGYDGSDIIKMLAAASELGFQELITYLQSFLIENESSWMEQNFSLMHKTSFENNSFLELQKYCIDLISKEPDKVFKSTDLSSIPEKLITSIVQSDHKMTEIQVWENVLKWGLSQHPELPNDPELYSKEDFITLKGSVEKCIPFIKFNNLSSEEFSGKILPYKKILPKELYKDLLKYFLNPNNQSIKSESHQSGEEVNRDETEFESTKKLAEKGDLNAQFQLGYYYDKGIGTEINKSKAFELFKVATERGNSDAQYSLSILYQSGEGTNKDEKRAFELIKDLAEKEYLSAQFQLGYYYDEGIGTNVNKSKAFELYKIAAGKGDNDAQYNLSLLYQFGQGVNKDERMAFELIKNLADKEDLNAQCQLGYYYSNGIGTEINKFKAFDLYKIAADNGNKGAQYNLALMYQSGEGVYKNQEKAFELIKDLADKGDVDAQYQLGNCYLNGIGTDINNKKAFELISKTARNNHRVAQNVLGSLYKKGQGITKDLKRASFWLRKAAENDNKNLRYNSGEKSANKGHKKARKKFTPKTNIPTIFVSNLPFSMDDDGLKDVFKDYNVISARVVRSANGGRSKGYGFVELADKGEQKSALEELKDTKIEGRVLGFNVALSNQ